VLPLHHSANRYHRI